MADSLMDNAQSVGTGTSAPLTPEQLSAITGVLNGQQQAPSSSDVANGTATLAPAVEALGKAVAKAHAAEADQHVKQFGLAQATIDHKELLAKLTDMVSSSIASGGQGATSATTQPPDANIAAAQSGQTMLPSETVVTPEKPANVRRGTFESDTRKGWFENVLGLPQAYVDKDGVTHFKPAGSLMEKNNPGINVQKLQEAQQLQELSGSGNVSPKDSIAYQLELAKQTAEKTPMNQAQKAELKLSYEKAAIDLGVAQANQFMTQALPTITTLQSVDQIMSLAQAAQSGDSSAQANMIEQTRTLLGSKNNILGQNVLGKLRAMLAGNFDKNSMKQLTGVLQSFRDNAMEKIAVAQKATQSKIGPLKLGDKDVAAGDLMNHPYYREASIRANTFKNEADAKKAALPEGTPVSINGQTGIWSNK